MYIPCKLVCSEKHKHQSFSAFNSQLKSKGLHWICMKIRLGCRLSASCSHILNHLWSFIFVSPLMFLQIQLADTKARVKRLQFSFYAPISPSPRSPLGLCHGDGFNPNKLIYLSISARPIIWCGLWSNPDAELCKEEWDRTYLNTVVEITHNAAKCASPLLLSWTVSSGWFEFWLLSLFWFICLALGE